MKINTLLAAIALATASASYAGPYAPAPMNPVDPYAGTGTDAGWYFGLNGGFLWMNDVHVNNLDFDFSTGWSALGALGYQFGNGFGLGVSTGYMRGEFESVSAFGTKLGLDADMHMIPVTINGSYTLDLTDTMLLYFGGGLGTAWSELNADSIQGVPVSAKTDGWNFAWQTRAGVGFKVTEGVSLNLGYRFMSILDGVADYDNADSHMAEAGFKVRF
jgi:opacity protein-like surface antigen